MQVLSSKISEDLSPTKVSKGSQKKMATNHRQPNTKQSKTSKVPMVKLIDELNQFAEINKQINELSKTHISINAKLVEPPQQRTRTAGSPQHRKNNSSSGFRKRRKSQISKNHVQV